MGVKKEGVYISKKKRILAAFLYVFACLAVLPAPQAMAADVAVVN